MRWQSSFLTPYKTYSHAAVRPGPSMWRERVFLIEEPIFGFQIARRESHFLQFLNHPDWNIFPTIGPSLRLFIEGFISTSLSESPPGNFLAPSHFEIQVYSDFFSTETPIFYIESKFFCFSKSNGLTFFSQRESAGSGQETSELLFPPLDTSVRRSVGKNIKWFSSYPK